MLFGYKLRGPLEYLAGPNVQQNVRQDVKQTIPFVRKHIRQEASLALSFAAARAKERYNHHHRPVEFQVGDNVYLRLHRGCHLPGDPLGDTVNKEPAPSKSQ